MSDSRTNPLAQDAQGSDTAANPISLADVLSLRVPVHWTEAVAVIEELCLVLSADGEPAAVPDPHGIVITAQGAVMIRRGAGNSTDVDAIGRMLNVLLDPVSTPIPLRLFVAHSIGSEKYQSVTAYGEALAYYARPDRAELIQALYLRCLNAPVAPLAALEELVTIEPPPPPRTPVPAPARRMLVPRWMRIAAVLVLLAFGSFFLMRQFAGNGGATPVAGLRAAAAGMAKAVQRLVAPRPPITSEPGLAAQPVEAVPARTRSSRVRGDVPGAVATTEAADDRGSSDESSSPAPVPVSAERLPDLVFSLPTLVPPVSSPSASFDASRTVVAVDDTVYSSASPDVQPPVMFSPKLPPLPPSDPYMRGTNTMELLIDEKGLVQQARLTSPPVRMSDMLLLSPAKTWKFHPALKNGQPVKYRLSLSWVVAPP